MPQLFSFLGSILLLFINIFSILVFVSFFLPEIKNNVSKYNALLVTFLISVLNFLILYRGEKYKEIFDEISKKKDAYKKWDSAVKIYIIFSIVLFILMLVLVDLQNHGKI